MACSCIYNQYDQQKRHYSPGYDLPLGSADSLKKSQRWFLQTSLQAAQIWISPGRTTAPTAQSPKSVTQSTRCSDLHRPLSTGVGSYEPYLDPQRG